MKKLLKEQYERLKASHLGSHADEVPAGYRSNFVSYGGAAEIQHIVGEMVPPTARRVLVIGVFGGRDYFYLKIRGTHELHAVDLAQIEGFDNLQVANVEDPLPFPDQYFDAIVMNEVVEHLVEDGKALKNVARVLKDDGVFVISVPFLHEAEPTHIRVHTRASVERLLTHCGFKPERIIERPGAGFFLPAVNWVNHALSAALFMSNGRTVYSKTLPLLSRFEAWAGTKPNPLRRFSGRWGAYFLCRKLPRSADYVEENRERFCKPSAAT